MKISKVQGDGYHLVSWGDVKHLVNGFLGHELLLLPTARLTIGSLPEHIQGAYQLPYSHKTSIALGYEQEIRAIPSYAVAYCLCESISYSDNEGEDRRDIGLELMFRCNYNSTIPMHSLMEKTIPMSGWMTDFVAAPYCGDYDEIPARIKAKELGINWIDDAFVIYASDEQYLHSELTPNGEHFVVSKGVPRDCEVRWWLG